MYISLYIYIYVFVYIFICMCTYTYSLYRRGFLCERVLLSTRFVTRFQARAFISPLKRVPCPS